ncbi:uncharacterized protein [Miscanthus floridulus]|uniref:uncharacterized protein n=1 Tax=Miscanthus floridulus TaxID=154761 RepID=UPI0034575DA7
MHRQLSLSASPKQQQQPPDGTGDAAQAMAVAEDESSASHSHSKASRGWSATARDERAIHLIPLLTFLCFLLLFLCSHDPSACRYVRSSPPVCDGINVWTVCHFASCCCFLDMSSFAGGGGGGGARSGNRRLRMF